MRKIRAYLVRLGGLFYQRARERNLADEIESHLQLHIDENLRTGMSPQEARRVALQKFGGVEAVKEACRDRRSIPFLETLARDLQYGIRTLRRSPAFTAVAVVSLALGIGANTATFSVIDALMLRQMAVWKPGELVLFRFVQENGQPGIAWYPEFERLRGSTQQVFSGVAASWLIDRSNITVNPSAGEAGAPGSPDVGEVTPALVSGSYFSTLGVRAVIGRTLTEDDNRVPGGHPVAVISYGYWERRFARAPDIVGRTFTRLGTTYTIIGVTAGGFTGHWVGWPTDLWIPFMMHRQAVPYVPGLERFPTVMFGRLKTGVTIDQAQAASRVAYQQILTEEAGSTLSPEHARLIARRRLELEPAARGYSPQRQALGPALLILMSMVALVLLIACANVANLLLARSAARQREMAVRLAIGAGRARIVRQLLTESVLLATMGGLLGLLFARGGTRVLTAGLAAQVSLDVHPDARTLAFTAALCLLATIHFGFAPAFRWSKTPFSTALAGRNQSTTGSRARFGLGRALVIAQVALSLVLLIGAGLLVRTLRNLERQDLGFDRKHLLVAWIRPVMTGRTGPALVAFCQTLRERLSSLPGVHSASMSGPVLVGYDEGNPSDFLRVQGQTPKPGLVIERYTVAPKFFETVGIPLLAGRDFTERDTESAPRVTAISETMARFFFGSENPIGKRVAFGNQTGYPTEIVGVVQNAKYGSPRDRRGIFYVPYHQNQVSLMGTWWVAVRTAGEPARLASRLRQELHEIDRNLPVFKINTIEEQRDEVLAQERLIAILCGLFAFLAVLLACVGLYGVIAYAVASRTHEIGIRLALGATRGRVLGEVLTGGFSLTLTGIAIGVPAALAATRLVSTRLFGVRATDPLTIATASLLLIAVAAWASFLPARRASKVDPMVALRYE